MSSMLNESTLPTNSLFIPRIDYSITKQQLKTFFEDTFDCFVGRIDFVAFQNYTGVGRRAFIHFLYFYDNDFANALIKNKTLLINVNGFELTVLINKNPIPETTLNPAQLAANNEFLSEEVKRQSEEIEYLKHVQNEFHFALEQMRRQLEILNPYQVKRSNEEIQEEIDDLEAQLQNLGDISPDSYHDYDLDSV